MILEIHLKSFNLVSINTFVINLFEIYYLLIYLISILLKNIIDLFLTLLIIISDLLSYLLLTRLFLNLEVVYSIVHLSFVAKYDICFIHLFSEFNKLCFGRRLLQGIIYYKSSTAWKLLFLLFQIIVRFNWVCLWLYCVFILLDEFHLKTVLVLMGKLPSVLFDSLFLNGINWVAK